MKKINKIFLVLSLITFMFLLNPNNINAATNGFSWNTQDPASYEKIDGRSVYTYNLAITVSGNSKFNYVEGYVTLNNLELVSMEALNGFNLVKTSDLNFKLTSNHLFSASESRVKVIQVKVRRIDESKACNFGYNFSTPKIVTTNSFSITKEAIRDGKVIKEVKAGETFQYKITVKSNNNVLKTDAVTVTDTIPGEFEILGVSDSGTVNGQKITWNLGSFNTGVNTKVLTVNVKAKTNTKGMTKNTAILNVGDNTFKDDVDVNIVYSKIEITKDASQDKVAVGQEFYYIIKVKNVGTGVSNKVTVTDNLDSRLEITKNIEINGYGSYSCVDNDCDIDLGTIKAGETKTIKIYVKVKNVNFPKPQSADVIIDTIPNTAIATEENGDTVRDDATVEVVEEVLEPDVSIKKNVSVKETKPKEEFTYEIIVTNNNSLNLSDVVITDIIDNNLIIVDALNATNSNNKLTWHVNLMSNETKTFTIKVRVKDNVLVDKIDNKATVTVNDKDKTSNIVTVIIKKEKPKSEEPKKDSVVKKPDNKKKNDVSNPKTGEIIGYGALGLGICAGAGIFFYVKKKNKFYRI